MNNTNPTDRSKLQQEYLAELAKLENAAPATIQITPIAIIAIISNIQLASRHPDVAHSPVTRIAIQAARQLQSAFPPHSAAYKVMELGWNPEEDLPAPEEEDSDDYSEEDALNLYNFLDRSGEVYEEFIDQ